MLAINQLITQLKDIIQQARNQAYRAVDAIQVQTYWRIGQHIVEFEQQGENRAQYGSKLLAQLSEQLIAEFGKGFDARNLRYMRSFYQTFPIWNALRPELCWTHYRRLLRVNDIRRLNAKRVINPLINTEGIGLDIAKLQAYINLIPQDEISEDITKMYNFITQRLNGNDKPCHYNKK